MFIAGSQRCISLFFATRPPHSALVVATTSARARSLHHSARIERRHRLLLVPQPVQQGKLPLKMWSLPLKLWSLFIISFLKTKYGLNFEIIIMWPSAEVVRLFAPTCMLYMYVARRQQCTVVLIFTNVLVRLFDQIKKCPQQLTSLCVYSYSAKLFIRAWYYMMLYTGTHFVATTLVNNNVYVQANYSCCCLLMLTRNTSLVSPSNNYFVHHKDLRSLLVSRS